MASEVDVSELERDLYVPRMATIVDIQQQTDLEKLFTIEINDGHGLDHRPGQFVQLAVFGVGEAPISISSMDTGAPAFELCIREVGNVTGAMHDAEIGDIVGIRGPYGNGFAMDEFTGNELLIVAGGIGLVPLRSVIQSLIVHREKFDDITILYGFKSPEEMLFEDELEQWQQRDDLDMRLTVDKEHPDWAGHVGVITTLFPEIDVDPKTVRTAICGPPIMYQFVIAECKNLGIPDEHIHMSFERRMKCGVGKCGHCQMNNKYVCIDGPCFKYSEVKHLWEAI